MAGLWLPGRREDVTRLRAQLLVKKLRQRLHDFWDIALSVFLMGSPRSSFRLLR